MSLARCASMAQLLERMGPSVCGFARHFRPIAITDKLLVRLKA